MTPPSPFFPACPPGGTHCILFGASFQTYAPARALEHVPVPMNAGMPLRIDPPTSPSHSYSQPAHSGFHFHLDSASTLGTSGLHPFLPLISASHPFFRHASGLEVGLTVPYGARSSQDITFQPSWRFNPYAELYGSPHHASLNTWDVVAPMFVVAAVVLAPVWIPMALIGLLVLTGGEDRMLSSLTRSPADTELSLTRLFEKKFGISDDRGFRKAGDINRRLVDLIMKKLQNYRGGRITIARADLEDLNLTDKALIKTLSRKGFTLRELSDFVDAENKDRLRVEAPGSRPS